MPTKPQIDAVRGVLLDKDRNRRMRDALSSIVVFMNLDPTAPRQKGDTRVPGAGPHWWIQATGAPSAAVVQAAAYGERIAAILIETRDAVSSLTIDPKDKRLLRVGIGEQAAVWTARARMWRNPPRDEAALDEALARIQRHRAASEQAMKSVHAYLPRTA